MIDLDQELKRAQEEMRSGSLDRALAILDALLKTLEAPPDPARLTEEDRLRALVKVLNNLGVVHKNLGALQEAARSLEASLEIARQLGDEGIRMRTGILSNLGLLHSRRKLYGKGLEAFEEALKLATEHPEDVDTRLKVKLHNNRALFFVRFGEPGRAREELAQALEAGRGEEANGNEADREAWLNANLGMIHAELGDEEIYDPARQDELFRQARVMFLRSAELYGGEGYLHNRLKQLVNVAEIEIRLGALEEARRQLDEAGREAERIRAGRLLCEVAHVKVELALRRGSREEIVKRVREAVQVFRDYEGAPADGPHDLPAREARLEGILRRAGQPEALKVLAEIKNKREKVRDTPKRTSN